MPTLKTPDRQWSGVFVSVVLLWLISIAVHAEAGACLADGELQWAQIKHIVDGDTLQLSDGRKVRVLAINTPELARMVANQRQHGAQPLAEQARQEVVAFFAGDSRVGLQPGADTHDRYGRLLADVFRANGDSLSAHLLAAGMAWQVLVPPNDRYWRCLQRSEALARDRLLGVWAQPLYWIKQASELTLQDAGFQRVQGTVQSVSRSRGGWWIQLGRLAIRLEQRDLVYFGDTSPANWLNKPLTIRGWVIDRSKSAAVKKHGFSALMINLRHPVMLK